MIPQKLYAKRGDGILLQFCVKQKLIRFPSLFFFFVVLFTLSFMLPKGTSAEEDFVFNFDQFIGDRIVLPEYHSSTISDFTVDVTFPPQHMLLPKAKPYARLFTKDNKLLKTLTITGEHNSITVDTTLEEEMIYAEVSLFYCRVGEQGICLMRNLLFEVYLDPQLPAENLTINYIVPDDY
jgi:hypothetical protein